MQMRCRTKDTIILVELLAELMKLRTIYALSFLLQSSLNVVQNLLINCITLRHQFHRNKPGRMHTTGYKTYNHPCVIPGMP